MITSTANAQVSQAWKLKKRALREERRRFLVEGAQAAGEAIEAGAAELLFHAREAGGRADPLVARAEAAGAKAVEVSDEVMAHLTSTVTPQGILAVARFVDVSLALVSPAAALVPVLCEVRDPGNAGTVLRSADAAGAGAIVFTDSSVDVYNPKTVRASAGSLFHLPVVRGVPVGEAVALLRERGLRVLAAAADGEASLYEADLAAPTAVLFGNEAWGLPPEVRGLADASVRVPIHGKAESLNLAAAAVLFLFEAARQRAAGGHGGGLAAAVAASAHDLRSSLTALKGFAATLATMWERLEEDGRLEIVKGMSLDAERTAVLVKMLVDAARMEQGGFRAVPERRDAAEAARWVAEVFGRSRDAPRVEAAGSAEARVDPDRLQAVLLALCDAAVAFGGEGPVEVRVAPGGGGAVVEVARAGPGVSAEEVEAAFETPRKGGKGKIVPWLARRVAEGQGWGVSTEVGEKLRLRLTLPG